MASKRAKKRRKRAGQPVNVSKLHREASRYHIGTVPPTRVGPGHKKKGGGHVTIDNVDLGHFIHMSEAKERREAPIKTTKSSLTLQPYVPSGKVEPKYTGRTQPGASPYSDEVKAHVEFLTRTHGMTAASTYLNDMRRGNMEATGMGPIERAIKETEEKVRQTRAQVQTMQLELARQEAALDSLRQAHGLVTGKIQPQAGAAHWRGEAPQQQPLEAKKKHRTGIRPGNVEWRPILIEVLGKKASGMTRTELKNAMLIHQPNANPTTPYGVISTALKDGTITEIDNVFYLTANLEHSTASQEIDNRLA